MVHGEPSRHTIAMQGYMIEFEKTMLIVVKLQVDYCAWGHFYMKPTHVWTSMVYCTPKGDHEGGTGRCRQRCPFGSRGEETGRWGHDFKIGQKNHQLVRGRGRKSNKGAVLLGLHREFCRVKKAWYKRKRKRQCRGGQFSTSLKRRWGEQQDPIFGCPRSRT